MNKSILVLSLALALAPSVHAQTAAPSPLKDLSVSGAMDYESQYVFRGKKVTNSAFQPSVNLGYPVYGGTLNAYMWTSQPIGTRGTSNSADEIDSGLFYTYPLAMLLPGLSTDIGYQYYWYPEANGVTPANFPNSVNVDRTNEVHVGFNYDTTSILAGYNINPSFYYYHDFNLDGEVVQGGLSYTWDISNSIGLAGTSIVPSVQVGWDHQNRSFGDELPAGIANERNGYTYWLLSLEGDYKINSFATAFAGFRYSGNNDGTKTNAFTWDPQGGGTKNSIWGGAGIRFGM
jgi:hypothetical protein